jgi:hypothetical protein
MMQVRWDAAWPYAHRTRYNGGKPCDPKRDMIEQP